MYVVGTVKFDKGVDKISDMEVVKGNRPKGPQDIPGCDPEVLRTMNGTTRARVGAGCALVINDITLLAWSSSRVMGNLRNKVPELFDSSGELIARQGLVGLWRDGGASGTFWCADVCAGVAETTELVAAAAKEAVEAGFFYGCGEDITPGVLDDRREPQLTQLLSNETIKEWDRLGIVKRMHTIPVDWQTAVSQVVYTTEPESGSVEVNYQVTIDFPEVDGGWHVRDTEHMKIDGKFEAINRHPVLIVPIEGQAPVLLGFGPDGLDPHGTIARLEGSNLETMINGKVRAVLTALGWLDDQPKHYSSEPEEVILEKDQITIHIQGHRDVFTGTKAMEVSACLLDFIKGGYGGGYGLKFHPRGYRDSYVKSVVTKPHELHVEGNTYQMKDPYDTSDVTNEPWHLRLPEDDTNLQKWLAELIWKQVLLEIRERLNVTFGQS